MSKADIIITVSEYWAQKLREKYSFRSSSIFCIENGYDEEFLNSVELNINKISLGLNKKNIVYTGTLYKCVRDPVLLFKVIEENYSYFKHNLEIVFYGLKETEYILDCLSRDYPYAGKIIKYGGFLSAADTIKKQKMADAFIFFENDKKNNGMITGKIYEYIYFNKPIICIGITGGTFLGKFLYKTGLCILCGDSMEKIKNSLFGLIEEEIKIKPNREYIVGFSREKQTEKLISLIETYRHRDC